MKQKNQNSVLEYQHQGRDYQAKFSEVAQKNQPRKQLATLMKEALTDRGYFPANESIIIDPQIDECPKDIANARCYVARPSSWQFFRKHSINITRKDLQKFKEHQKNIEEHNTKVKAYIQLIQLPTDRLINVLLQHHLGRPSASYVFSNIGDRRTQLLTSILCRSVYRVSSGKDGSSYYHCCCCREQENQTLFEPLTPTPVPPIQPNLIPIPYFPEDGIHNEWKELKQRIESIQKRLGQLDFSTISSMSKTKKTIRRRSDLKAVLQHSRKCDASDPRDRVYAFLGLADRGYAIIPDYSVQNTIVHTLISTAQRIVEHEKTLDILQYVQQGRDKLGCFLPSWVPDWTSKADSFGFTEYCALRTEEQESEPFNASRGLSAKVEFRTDKMNGTNVDLKVKGIFVDTLDEREDASQDHLDVQSYLTPSGQRIFTSKVALMDDEIWVLHGASKPVVLRPEGDDTFGFVSEALMYDAKSALPSDVMFGHMIGLAEEGSIQTRDIWLI